jgi:putative ABC transport system permease protein
MLLSDLQAALRSFRRRRGYAAVSIGGLALGLLCAAAVALYVHDELSYDRFHEHADRIVRMEVVLKQGDHVFAMPPRPEVTGRLLAESPLVEALVRPVFEQRVVVRAGERSGYEENLIITSPEFFDIFSFPLARGDHRSLKRPKTVLLTREVALRYFPDTDPIGQTIELGEEGTFEVTGLFKPVPANSTIRFGMIASNAGREPRPAIHMVYALLRPTAETDEVAATVLAATKELSPGMPLDEARVTPLTDLHMHALSTVRGSDLAGNARYLYIFGGVGMLILLLAGVNFINLATARALTRAREVGVRKTLGAQRGQLIRQYLMEAGLQSGVAFAVAAIALVLALPALNSLVGKGITLSMLPHGLLLVGGLALWAVTTLLAGLYPAFVLSGYHPMAVIHGGPAREGRGGGRLRRGLVVFQFAATIALLIGMFTMQRQLDHMQAQHLALAPEQVLLLEPRADVLPEYAAFKEALRAIPGISHVSLGHVPGGMGTPVILEGEEEQRPTNTMHVDEDFLTTLGLRLLAGRDLEEDRPGEVTGAVLINQAAVREFGFHDDPIGRRIRRMTADLQMVESEVVGVVQDFPFRSLRTEIGPQVIALRGEPGRQPFGPPSVMARIQSPFMQEAIVGASAVWQRFAPDHPFEYAFLDERFGAFYQAEARLQRLFGIFSGMALALACLGLVGLASYTAERRTKEIGVRKVLGASAASIATLLSREFLMLVVVAFVIGAPVAYWYMSRWLQDFAYRIELGPAVFAAAGLMAVAIAVLAAGYHAFRAASTDPVRALRSE